MFQTKVVKGLRDFFPTLYIYCHCIITKLILSLFSSPPSLFLSLRQNPSSISSVINYNSSVVRTRRMRETYFGAYARFIAHDCNSMYNSPHVIRKLVPRLAFIVVKLAASYSRERNNRKRARARARPILRRVLSSSRQPSGGYRRNMQRAYLQLHLLARVDDDGGRGEFVHVNAPRYYTRHRADIKVTQLRPQSPYTPPTPNVLTATKREKITRRNKACAWEKKKKTTASGLYFLSLLH